MPLADITARILERARGEADEILAEARNESEAKLREVGERLERDQTRDAERVAAEARAVEERAVAGAQLEAKKETLAARQDLIDAVLGEAMRSLSSADESVYVDFLRSRILAAPMRGDVEIVVDDSDRARIEKHLPALQEAIDAAGRDLKLRLGPPGRAVHGGFVLRQGRVEFNASLDAIRRSQEEELRAAAAAMLFPKD
jgi:V/A-type H+-transporting ATPase subunit E